jgi:phage terminase large subunit-like protein
MEVFKVLIFDKEPPREAIYDGSTKTTTTVSSKMLKSVFTVVVNDESNIKFVCFYNLTG